MAEKTLTVVVDLGAHTTKLGVAGQKMRVAEPTPEAMQRELTLPGRDVHAGTLGMCLRRLSMRYVHAGLDTVQAVVTVNTAGKASIATALKDISCTGMTALNTQACALAAAGAHTGIVVDIGEHETRCVPVFEGEVLITAARFAPLSAVLVKDGFTRAFKKLNGFAECRAAFLEEHGRVGLAADADEVQELVTSQASLRLPVTSCYNVLFDGSEPSAESYTLQGLVLAVLDAVSVINRRALSECIVLAGGVADAPGLPQRLAKELIAAGRPDIRIATPPFAASHLACTGASLIKATPGML